MNTPTISQYAESVCHPYGRFRTLGEPAVERDAYGEPCSMQEAMRRCSKYGSQADPTR